MTSPLNFIPKGLPVDINTTTFCMEPNILSTQGGNLGSQAAVLYGRDSEEYLKALAQDLGHAELTDSLRESLPHQSGFREIPFGGLPRKEVDGHVYAAFQRDVRGLNSAIMEKLKASNVPEEVLRSLDLKETISGQLASKADQLAGRFGGLLPGDLTYRDNLLRFMHLHPDQLKENKGYQGPFTNQQNNMDTASKFSVMGLKVGLESLPSFGGPLPEVLGHPYRHGTVDAHAFPGLDNWYRLFQFARQGKSLNPQHLMFALECSAGSLFDNYVKAPRFDYGSAGGSKENPEGLERVIPADLTHCRIGNTGGPNISIDGACAAAAYALVVGSLMLKQGEVDAVTAIASDATFDPFIAPAVVSGFGLKAPATLDDLVVRLIDEGVTPKLKPGEKPLDRWLELPASIQEMAMWRACAPGTQHASGLVFSEGAAAFNVISGAKMLRDGDNPLAFVAGYSLGSGESGLKDMAGMSQGGITTSGLALDRALQDYNVVPNVTYLHGTSTKLFNIAEIMMLTKILRARGITGMMLSGLQALFGHSMGASAMISMAIALMSLKEQATPLLLNFDSSEIDPRYAERIPEAFDHMRFESGTYRGSIPGILVQSFGFGNKNGSVVLGRVPHDDKEAAVELWRALHATDNQIACWLDKRSEREEYKEKLYAQLRTGELSHHDMAAKLGWG